MTKVIAPLLVSNTHHANHHAKATASQHNVDCLQHFHDFVRLAAVQVIDEHYHMLTVCCLHLAKPWCSAVLRQQTSQKLQVFDDLQAAKGKHKLKGESRKACRPASLQSKLQAHEP